MVKNLVLELDYCDSDSYPRDVDVLKPDHKPYVGLPETTAVSSPYKNKLHIKLNSIIFMVFYINENCLKPNKL